MHLALLEEKAKEKNRGVRASAMTVKWTTPSQPSNLAARRPKGPYPQKAATPMVRCGGVRVRAPGSSTGGRRPPPLLLCAPGSSSLPQPSRATHCHAPRSPSPRPKKRAAPFLTPQVRTSLISPSPANSSILPGPIHALSIARRFLARRTGAIGSADAIPAGIGRADGTGARARWQSYGVSLGF
jgi:hypothetical protein